jgi:hypothetical protein
MTLTWPNHPHRTLSVRSGRRPLAAWVESLGFLRSAQAMIYIQDRRSGEDRTE